MPAVAPVAGRPPHGIKRNAHNRKRGMRHTARGRVKLGLPSRIIFIGRVREPVDGDTEVMAMIEPLLTILATMLKELGHVTKQVVSIAST
jgi:hypothetical protein